MLVPPAPQYESAKDHRQTNPKVGSHLYYTILPIIVHPCKGCPWGHFNKSTANRACGAENLAGQNQR
jgi:hypothetical protein